MNESGYQFEKCRATEDVALNPSRDKGTFDGEGAKLDLESSLENMIIQERTAGCNFKPQ